MEENLADSMMKTADVLHWLGRHREATAIMFFSRWLRAVKVATIDRLEEYIEAYETSLPEDEQPPPAPADKKE